MTLNDLISKCFPRPEISISQIPRLFGFSKTHVNLHNKDELVTFQTKLPACIFLDFKIKSYMNTSICIISITIYCHLLSFIVLRNEVQNLS